MSLSEHFAADAAREAVDRLSDERDAALDAAERMEDERDSAQQRLAFAGEFVRANKELGEALVMLRADIARSDTERASTEDALDAKTGDVNRLLGVMNLMGEEHQRVKGDLARAELEWSAESAARDADFDAYTASLAVERERLAGVIRFMDAAWPVQS